MRTSSGTARAPGMSSGYIEWLKVMSLIVRVWQNVVHWRREWQTTSVFLPWEPHEQYEKAKRYNTERWTPQVGRCPIYYWGRAEKWLQKEWRGWAKVGKKPSHNKHSPPTTHVIMVLLSFVSRYFLNFLWFLQWSFCY